MEIRNQKPSAQNLSLTKLLPEGNNLNLGLEAKKIALDHSYVSVAMPIAQKADENPEKTERRNLEMELQKKFEDCLNNFKYAEFSNKYDPIVHKVQAGDVPAFLKELFEKRVGAGLDEAVEKLLKSSEELLKKNNLGIDEITEIIWNYAKILNLSQQRNIAYKMLKTESVKDGTININVDHLKRLEEIASSLLNNKDFEPMLRAHLALNFKQDNVFLDLGIAKEVYATLQTIENLPHQSKVPNYLENNSRALREMLSDLQGQLFVDYLTHIRAVMSPIERNPAQQALTSSEIENLKPQFAKINQVASINSDLLHIVDLHISSIWLDNLSKVEEAITPWKRTTEANVSEFKPEIDLTKTKEVIEANKLEANQKLDKLDKIVGNSTLTDMTRSRIDLDYGIQEILENLYGSAFLEFVQRLSTAKYSITEKGSIEAIGMEFNKKIESLDRLLPLCNDRVEGEILKLKNNRFGALSKSIHDSYEETRRLESSHKLSNLSIEEQKDIKPLFEDYRNQKVWKTLIQLRTLAEDILPITDHQDFLQRINEGQVVKPFISGTTYQAINLFREESTFNAHEFIESTAKDFNTLLATFKNHYSDDSYSSFKESVGELFEDELKIIHGSDAAEALIEEYFENGKNIDLQIVHNILENYSNRIERDLLKVIDVIHMDPQRAERFQESIKELEEKVKENPNSVWDIILDLESYNAEHRRIPNRHFDILSDYLSKYLKDELAEDQEVFLQEYLLKNPPKNEKIIMMLLKDTKEDSTVIDKLSMKILNNAVDTYSTGNIPSEQFIQQIRSQKELSPEAKLKAVATAMDVDKGIDSQNRTEAVELYQKMVKDDDPNSKLDIRAVLCFPNIIQLSQKNLGSFNELQAMNLLYQATPFQTGKIANQWLLLCAQNGQQQASEQVLKDLLMKDHNSLKLFDQLSLPRILDRPAQDGLDSSALEFLVGFASATPGMERSQVELFNKITGNRYIEELNWGVVSKYVTKQTNI